MAVPGECHEYIRGDEQEYCPESFHKICFRGAKVIFNL